MRSAQLNKVLDDDINYDKEATKLRYMMRGLQINDIIFDIDGRTYVVASQYTPFGTAIKKINSLGLLSYLNNIFIKNCKEKVDIRRYYCRFFSSKEIK